MSDDGAADGRGKRARGDDAAGPAAADERGAFSSFSSSSSSSSSSSRAARASRRATGAPAQPRRARRRTAAERARLADLFLDVIGVVVAHNRGQFAHECWQCLYLCRETRYVAGVTQPGSIAVMVFHGCRLGGVSELLEEARACKREEYGGYKGTTQLIRAAKDNDVERVRQLFRLGCPTTVVNALTRSGSTALCFAIVDGGDAVTRELLAHCADVNVKCKRGVTPLMWASSQGHIAIVRLLCDTPGIDLTARRGMAMLTALGWALYHDNAEVAAFLRSRGAPE